MRSCVDAVEFSNKPLSAIICALLSPEFIKARARRALHASYAFSEIKSAFAQCKASFYPITWSKDRSHHDWFKFAKFAFGGKGDLLQKGSLVVLSQS